LHDELKVPARGGVNSTALYSGVGVGVNSTVGLGLTVVPRLHAGLEVLEDGVHLVKNLHHHGLFFLLGRVPFACRVGVGVNRGAEATVRLGLLAVFEEVFQQGFVILDERAPHKSLKRVKNGVQTAFKWRSNGVRTALKRR